MPDTDKTTPTVVYVTIDLDPEDECYEWEVDFGDTRLNRCGGRPTIGEAISAVQKVIAEAINA